uniref:Reelin domain-containing protein n=1 Tax=Alexandrium catenella TaxID=2925 RepID=A0A7S1SF36_ALECA
MAVVLARLAIAAAAARQASAHASYWWTRGGGCRQPAAGDLMMGNLAVEAGVTNEVVLAGTGGSYSPGSQHTLQISTAASEHLLYASSGSFSTPSAGGTGPPSYLNLTCVERTVAWGGDQAAPLAGQRSVTWTAPSAGTGTVSFTLAVAAGYGPVTIYVHSVTEGLEMAANYTITTEAPTTTSTNSTPARVDTSASGGPIQVPWIAALFAFAALVATGVAGR